MNTAAAHTTAIRPARTEDLAALVRLAALDSANPPVSHAGLLVAESDGELIAAVSIAAGSAIADPFVPTANVIKQLNRRAAGLRRAMKPRRRIVVPRPAEALPRMTWLA